MAFEIGPSEYFEVATYFAMQGQIAINRRMYQYDDLFTGLPTNTTIVDAAFAGSGMRGQYASIICNLASVLGNSYRLMPNPGRLATEYLTGMAIVGSAGANAFPKQVSGFIRYRSSFMGKRGEARNYIPFPSAADGDADGSPTTSYIARLAGLAGYVVTPLAVNNTGGAACRIRPVLQVAAGQPSSGGVITSYLCLDAWATQRRRGDFGRTNNSPFL